jgi:hypothetical protein
MSVLWRVSLMLVLHRLLLSRMYVVINALKILATIVSVFDLHVIYKRWLLGRYSSLVG